MQHRSNHDRNVVLKKRATLNVENVERACSTFFVSAGWRYDLQSPAFICLNALNGVQASNLSAPVRVIGPARISAVQCRSRILNLDLDSRLVNHPEGSTHAMLHQASSGFRGRPIERHWLRVTMRPR